MPRGGDRPPGEALLIAQGSVIAKFVGRRHKVKIVSEDGLNFKFKKSKKGLVMVIENEEHVFGKFNESVEFIGEGSVGGGA